MDGDRINERKAALAMNGNEFRAAGHRLVELVAEFLDSLPNRPVTRAESPSQIRELMDSARSLPLGGQDAADLLERTSQLLLEHSLFNGHPRFMGYITSSPAPIGVLADMLASAVNPNVGAWQLSPMATEIEAQTVRWVCDMVGYPIDCGGIFVSGGNMANIVCFLAARQAKAGWNVRAKGMSGSRLCSYCSKETHTWIEKAADIAGLGTEATRWIRTDADMRMDVAALREQIQRDIAAGDKPFMVAGTAGSVGTGAVDPLPQLAEICSEFDLWFHVDGAYGAIAAVADDAPADLKGMRHADSLAVDPHKWLYAPLEAGCALVSNAQQLRNTFSYHPPYYYFGDEAINYFDLGPQNSRGFRALKVWLALQQVGREGYARMVSDDMRLSRELFARVEKEPRLEALTQSLSITTFRYVPPGIDRSRPEANERLNELNKELLTRLQASGEAFLSNAVVDSKFALRACIVNFHTNRSDVEALVRLVVRLGQQAEAEAKLRT